MDKKKRLLAISTLSTLLALSIYASYEREYELSYHVYYENTYPLDKYPEECIPFGSYSKGDVYIGDEEYIELAKGYAKEDDVLIIMGEQNGDPNATILSSHEIKDKEDRNDILHILKAYDYNNPSEWERTIESMRVEWEIHNMLYNLGIERERTQDVDLDNSEEKKYSNQLLRKLIK